MSARIEGGSYEPALEPVSTVELAGAACQQLGAEAVWVSGTGAPVTVDRVRAARAVTSLCRCALRHGGLSRVDLALDGPSLALSPVTADVAPIIVGERVRDLGALVAGRVVDALGGSLTLEGERLVARLPPSL